MTTQHRNGQQNLSLTMGITFKWPINSHLAPADFVSKWKISALLWK